jgi:nucleoid-associated protein YgaU
MPAEPGAEEPPAEPVDPELAAVLGRIEEQGGARRITVQPGDTLGLYARALYGDALLYRRIFNANRTTIANPNTLRVGAVLTLPDAPQ